MPPGPVATSLAGAFGALPGGISRFSASGTCGLRVGSQDFGRPARRLPVANSSPGWACQCAFACVRVCVARQRLGDVGSPETPRPPGRSGWGPPCKLQVWTPSARPRRRLTALDWAPVRASAAGGPAGPKLEETGPAPPGSLPAG